MASFHGIPLTTVTAAPSALCATTSPAATSTHNPAVSSFSSTSPILMGPAGPTPTPKGKGKGTRRASKILDLASNPAVDPDPTPKPLRRSSKAAAASARPVPADDPAPMSKATRRPSRATAASVPTSASAFMVSASSPTHPHSASSSAPTARPLRTVGQKVRNRAAADKCRKMTKAAIEELEATEREAEDANAALKTQLQVLVAERLAFKNRLLEHHGCQCAMIHKWLRAEARKLAMESAAGLESEDMGGLRTPPEGLHSEECTAARNARAAAAVAAAGGEGGGGTEAISEETAAAAAPRTATRSTPESDTEDSANGPSWDLYHEGVDNADFAMEQYNEDEDSDER
ncbi:hypothetical protein GE09DRAFT_660257 [Coniochaeta sp. 2T2.1]|nr:hypothetical protein GE09DRAFT_660257 [Coniochaeta sp. 2T2.1]